MYFMNIRSEDHNMAEVCVKEWLGESSNYPLKEYVKSFFINSRKKLLDILYWRGRGGGGGGG